MLLSYNRSMPSLVVAAVQSRGRKMLFNSYLSFIPARNSTFLLRWREGPVLLSFSFSQGLFQKPRGGASLLEYSFSRCKKSRKDKM